MVTDEGAARTRRGWRAALAAAYVLGSAASALLPINPTDLDAFFLPSARIALAGHPLDIYSVRHDGIYPNANGPLSLVPLTGVAALAARLGWLDDMRLRRVLVMAVFSLITLLMAREAVLAVERLRGRVLPGWRRDALHLVFAAPPLIWHGVLLYGHVEQPLCLWLVLRAVRRLSEGRPLRAGMAAGLAMLTRTVSGIQAVAMLVALVAGRHRRQAAAYGAATAVTVAAGLAPLLLAAPGDTWFSLVTFRGALPIGGGSIWDLAAGTPLQGLGEHTDGVLVAAAATLASVLLAWRRRGPDPAEADLLGLLAVSALAFPLLIKTVWPYYLLDVYVLGTGWALANVASRPRRWLSWLLLPVTVSACGFVAEIGVSSPAASLPRHLESGGMFVLLSGLAVALGAAIWRRGGGAPVEAAAGRGRSAGACSGADGGRAQRGAAGADAAGAEAAGGAAAGAAGEAPGGAGVEVGPSGGVGQLASAALKGVGLGGGVGEAPGEGVA